MSDANKNANADADLESKMEYDVILHYPKSAANFNNSAATNKENTENTSPTLQVNNSIINRSIHLVSSNNLAQVIIQKLRKYATIS